MISKLFLKKMVEIDRKFLQIQFAQNLDQGFRSFNCTNSHLTNINSLNVQM